VHTWYPGHFGGPAVPAFTCVHDAVCTWPETATCIAIRMTPAGMDVCAPYGLADLLDGVWRRNPAPHQRGILRRPARPPPGRPAMARRDCHSPSGHRPELITPQRDTSSRQADPHEPSRRKTPSDSDGPHVDHRFAPLAGHNVAG
jgi:hypothetical protein